MTSEVAVQFEFRCAGCFHPLRAATDQVGQEITCRWCKQVVPIPEATEARIKQAEKPEVVPDEDEEGLDFERRELNREEIARIAEQRAMQKAAQKPTAGPANQVPASRLMRFVAVLVDTVLCLVAMVAGLIAVASLAQFGLLELDSGPIESVEEVPWQLLAVFAFFPTALTVFNWNMITVQGQTIGKLLCGIQIVDDEGDPPGFFRGVFLRNWVRSLLGGVIPFFGLADVLWIFFEPPRCLHDLIAGTHVVNKRK